MSYCVFHSGPHSGAVRQSSVKEVLVHRPLKPLPLAPAALEGLAALRGEVLPVFSLAGLAGASSMPAAPSRQTRILVLEDGGKRFGVLADKIEQLENPSGLGGAIPWEEGELSSKIDRLLAREAA